MFPVPENRRRLAGCRKTPFFDSLCAMQGCIAIFNAGKSLKM
jgi:hypothetical protein